ncbi:DNA ligase [Candidatus Roizmanbacteria bacterium CG03_land_8_20_14_0_80_35_26]|uniref:Probable DNA ligase n=1 Tax=Candidatus Roizmanbacteria bacterium CG03_land_8_20_14_0_80_35_26 TaxID=1974845 RepID=A0A2M7BXV6_9BACT|nr:MAG: DNA ligase [Candidatus Roizmanbacteria bacterium CG03_land_8_20_14_0_80_35_26]PJC80101.1 MAG: DNA ligase [Candidatus Roizmanbacteria bacterium CG_4_8_14_3_um_filter_36_12]
MKFSELSIYFERISQVSSRLEITRILAELFKKLTPDEIEKVVYLLQGKVRPAYEGIDFGMAEKMIIKAAVSALNIEKSFFEKEFKRIGDLGKTVEYFKKQYRSFEEKDLETIVVYEIFYHLATSSGVGSQEVKINFLAQLIRQMDSLSSRFLVRLPTGNIRMGFSDMTVLDAYSWMLKGDKSLRPVIEKAYHVRPELGFIGRIIKEKGIEFLNKIKPKLFTPIIMMKAERLSSAAEILKQIGQCLVEPKFDGFRLAVHYSKAKQEVRLYSRSLEDVTHMYPDIVSGVKKQVKADEIIFEGEAVGYNTKTGEFLPFQETAQRKRKYEIEKMAKEVPLRLFSFELLYKDGESFINKSFIERRKALEDSIITKKNLLKETVVVADEEKVNEESRLEKLFDEAIKKGLEGIIAKKIDGVYKPGAREWNWIKYKRSYSAKIRDTIDCLVMGYDYGKGKRTDFGIGAFLVGVLDEKKDQFVTIAKIGTGLTDKEWKQLRIKSYKLRVKEKPKNYFVNKMMECDVWAEPKIIVEIRSDEITKSPVHTAGLALRFPRLERFRDDKNPQEVTTLKELKSMVF